jgi:hypothetical protein
MFPAAQPIRNCRGTAGQFPLRTCTAET